MKKLYNLILKTYLGPFVLTFFITLFILVMQFLWKYVDEMIGKGLEWNVIVELLFYASANLVTLALPLAVLLSSIMTFGTLGEHYELVALKASGLSLQRIMFPLTVFIFVTSIGAFMFSNYAWPRANLKFATLLYDIRHKKPAIDIQDKIYYKEIDGYVIRVAHNNKETNTLEDILIYDHTDRTGNKKVIRADKGQMDLSPLGDYLILTLEEGVSYQEMKGKNQPHFQSHFKKEIVRFPLAGFELNRSDEERFKDNFKMLNISQLSAEMDTLRMKVKERERSYLDKTQTFSQLLADSFKLEKQYIPDEQQASLLSSIEPKRMAFVFEQAINNTRNHKTKLSTYKDELASRQKYINRHDIEWHRKFTLSVACIVLFFIGAPMGALIRKGGLGMPVIVSILFFLLFHITSITGEKLIKQGELGPIAGMWLATFILSPIGIFLTYKASTDASFLQFDFYRDVLKRFMTFFQGKSKK
ncbi:LptF/LptG family permease [Salibacteraceae bacterium]|nr:LptF/LptG family permease [Salibacteraceae bacterium]